MADTILFKEVESQTKKNAQIAAAGSTGVEEIITGTLGVDQYNRLFVHNTDANSDVEVSLDGIQKSTTTISGQGEGRFIVEANGGKLSIEPEFGIYFKRVFLVNLNSGAVVAANKVLVRAAKAVSI